MKALDDSHPTVGALTQLIPKATVLGGSFLSRLPPATSLDAETRSTILRETRKSVVNEVLAELTHRTTGNTHPVQGTHAGPRSWPSGYAGSVAHKGTVVLAAMASTKWMHSLGIDLERHADGSLLALADVLDQDGSARENELFLTYAFSAKEAVFKAQFPITNTLLDYSDVTLEWEQLDSLFFRARARTKGLQLEVRGCVPSRPWVVCAAGQVL